MKAVVHLLPAPQDIQAAMGQHLSQALGQFAQAGGIPGARIPIDSMEETPSTLGFEGATRSEVDSMIVRFVDEDGREIGLVPVHRINHVVYER